MYLYSTRFPPGQGLTAAEQCFTSGAVLQVLLVSMRTMFDDQQSAFPGLNHGKLNRSGELGD